MIPRSSKSLENCQQRQKLMALAPRALQKMPSIVADFRSGWPPFFGMPYAKNQRFLNPKIIYALRVHKPLPSSCRASSKQRELAGSASCSSAWWKYNGLKKWGIAMAWLQQGYWWRRWFGWHAEHVCEWPCDKCACRRACSIRCLRNRSMFPIWRSFCS